MNHLKKKSNNNDQDIKTLLLYCTVDSLTVLLLYTLFNNWSRHSDSSSPRLFPYRVYSYHDIVKFYDIHLYSYYTTYSNWICSYLCMNRICYYSIVISWKSISKLIPCICTVCILQVLSYLCSTVNLFRYIHHY